MTTGINFNQIPSTVNVPLFYLEINSTATVNPRTQLGTLLFGISTGDAGVEGEVISVGSASQAADLYGQGSQLANMVESYRANDRYGPLSCIGLSEGPSFRAASKLIKFEGTPIENGSVVLYVAGRRIAVPAVKGDDLYKNNRNDPGIIDSIIEFVNNKDSYPFTATGGGKDSAQELYIPLPIHPGDTLTDTNRSNKFSGSDQHAAPTSFVQPGQKYKLDPRNSSTSSVYYVPESDATGFAAATSLENEAGKLILINSDNRIRNRNNKGTEDDWPTYDSTFGSEIAIAMEGDGTYSTSRQIKLTLTAVSFKALRSLLNVDTGTVVGLRMITRKKGESDNSKYGHIDLPNILEDTADFPAAGLIFTGAITPLNSFVYEDGTEYDVTINAYSDSSQTLTGDIVPVGSFTTNSTVTTALTAFSPVSPVAPISPINYPGDVTDDAEWYIPLPINTTDSLEQADIDADAKFTDEPSGSPTVFVQPDSKYKLDPRNADGISSYYVAYADTTLYKNVPGPEYTAPSIIAVNMDDNSAAGPDNPNYRGGANVWDALVYSAGFNASADITNTNYPGDPPASLFTDKYFDTDISKRRGLVSWLLSFDYVLFTSKWQGADSNSYDVRGSINPTESLPKGLTITGLNENFTGGAGSLERSPEWVDGGLLSRIGDSEYLLSVHPGSGKLSPDLGYGEGKEFFDKLIDRWDYISQLYGHGIGAITGDHDITDVRYNSFFDAAAFSGFYFGNTPTPPWECASAVAGAMINQVRGNPKLPYNDIEIRGVIAPSLKDRPSYRMRERLLRAGISTTKSSGGRVFIERPVTGDPKWRDLSRRLSAAYIAVDLRDYVIGQIGRSVIADDGTVALPGSGVVTPTNIRSIIASRVNSLGVRGYVENFTDGDVSVSRDLDDPTRVNISIAVDPTNPLYVFASRLDVGN